MALKQVIFSNKQNNSTVYTERGERERERERETEIQTGGEGRREKRNREGEGEREKRGKIEKEIMGRDGGRRGYSKKDREIRRNMI